MSVYDIYKEAISAGGYSITSMQERIETVYACGKITKEERAELLDMASDKGDVLDLTTIMDKLADLENRLAVIEQTGVKVWVKGTITAKNQVVLYDALETGTMQYCQYVGSRESTTLKPCSAWGWQILSGINGRVVYRTEKTENGIELVEVEED